MLQQNLLNDLPILPLPRHNPVNVATVPQRSPFRYPGGKTWFVPTMRRWLEQQARKPELLIEPFAGGANVALAAVCESLVEHALLIELDPAVSAVWQVIVSGQGPDLAERIQHFELSLENLRATLEPVAKDPLELAFQTILKNRTRHGGILADGSGLIKYGEAGKGLSSRWYPETLAKRLRNLHLIRHRLSIVTGDALEVCQQYIHFQRAVFFMDPPYTAGGKKAGKRLYNYFDLDHPALFRLCQQFAGDFVMTYDNAPEARSLAHQADFDIRLMSMKNTHHAKMTELIIGRDLCWFEQ